MNRELERLQNDGELRVSHLFTSKDNYILENPTRIDKENGVVFMEYRVEEFRKCIRDYLSGGCRLEVLTLEPTGMAFVFNSDEIFMVSTSLGFNILRRLRYA